jgi:AGZA family xanthine/uracil permease-like MFS transporter
MEARPVLRVEIIGGAVNAALLAYALILNPTIVAATGMPFGALMTTTILLTIIFTLANGLYGNVPFAQSVYMGENAFFAFALVVAGGIAWQTALGIVFWAGVLFMIITLSGLRKRLAQYIPRELSLAWGSAVAIFLLYLAAFDAGLFKANKEAGLPTLPGQYTAHAVLAFFLLAILIIVVYRMAPPSIRGVGMLLSILAALAIGPALFGIKYPRFALGFEDPTPIIMRLNFLEAFKFWHLILIFFLIELVDVTGTLKALVTPMKLENEEAVIEKVMRVEGVSTAVGALFGQPTVGTYIESGGAVAAGARTGLASIVTALLFVPFLFVTPFFKELPFWFLLWATAPALAAVSGFILIKVFSEFDFRQNPAAASLVLLTLPGVFGGNLLLAFVLPLTATAGYEYLTKGKVSRGSAVLTLLGLVILAVYHY